jgi:hypothetical protein
MTCPVCGGELSEGDLFCGVCGAKLEVVRQAANEVEQPTGREIAGSRSDSVHHEAPSHDESYGDAERDDPEPPDGPGNRIGRGAVWRPRRVLVLAILAVVAVASLATFVAIKHGHTDPYSRVNVLLAALRDKGIDCPGPDYLDIPTSGEYRGMESVLCNNLWAYSFTDASSARARLDRDRAAALNPPVGVPPVPYTLPSRPKLADRHTREPSERPMMSTAAVCPGNPRLNPCRHLPDERPQRGAAVHRDRDPPRGRRLLAVRLRPAGQRLRRGNHGARTRGWDCLDNVSMGSGGEHRRFGALAPNPVV